MVVYISSSTESVQSQRHHQQKLNDTRLDPMTFSSL